MATDTERKSNLEAEASRVARKLASYDDEWERDIGSEKTDALKLLAYELRLIRYGLADSAEKAAA